MKIDEVLIKKWELLWNHYKLQDELLEKRRNILWIIQSFILGGYYYIYNKAICENDIIIASLANIIPYFGILVSIIMLITFNRHWHATHLTEQALRDTEYQINMVNCRIILDRFILDKKIFSEGMGHEWPHSEESFIKQNHCKLWSMSLWLNEVIPVIFIMLWLFLTYLMAKKNIVMNLYIIGIILIIYLLFLSYYAFKEGS